jgi:hypothetical protein
MPLLTEALARRYIRNKRRIKSLEKQTTADEKVLKDSGRSGAVLPLGLGYRCTQYSSLDTALARAALGPAKADECTVTRQRETIELPPE